MIRAGDLVLFQGDSITDAERSREAAAPNVRAGLGSGYAGLIAAQLLHDRPADGLRFLNRGVGGDRVVDLAVRWQAECLELRPSVLSVLIGVNDTWYRFHNPAAAVTVPDYVRVYRRLLEETREALPNIRIVLCEPFVLLCGAISVQWLPEMAERRAAVRDLAADFGAVFVPFQEAFDEAARRPSSPEYWADDGVHPTPAGHWLMARTWLRASGSSAMSKNAIREQAC